VGNLINIEMEQSMPKLTTIDRKTCGILRTAMQAALKSVAEEYGASIIVGHASYNGTEVKFKTTVSVVGEDGVIETETRADLKRFYPAMVDHVFMSRGIEYKVTGFKYRAPKNRWEIERTRDGKGFIAPDGLVGFDIATGAPRQKVGA
jgi:hypothetical protein